ncbi:iron complex transport system substrate-binding protein [Kribbella amoyensis]|uniref:Iron complex transport system substrate-binding protein n=1 Tax=Kribbella amoyensis TaxID=996641 RepID=A0A561BRD6_9ACTN|nr:iron-siderophore ABC transporter substrate-binding protein [Kribbella amoyensis]TWD81431.1 iron complex transport system substrate-binding protein [Kribbella amoyensis]
MSVPPVLRRARSSWVAVVAVVLALAASLVACGSDDGPETTAAGGEGFPVTVDHLFGSTTIPAKPQRVVTIGGGDMEAAIALGVELVAGADWFGFTETRGWVKDALGDRPAPKLIQAYEPKFEGIAALKPDLILYVNSVNDKQQYETFAAMAPTIAAPPGTKNVYGVAWQDQVRSIAKATGTSAEAEQVVQRTEALITDTAKANEEFAGKVITAGVYSSGELSAWLPSDPRMRLLTALGFKPNPRIAAMDNGDFYVKLPDEDIGKLDADLIFLAAADQNGKIDPGVTGNKLFAALPAVKAGHVAYFGGAPVINSNSDSGQFSSAFSIGGPLGIKYALTKLVPQLKDALTQN